VVTSSLRRQLATFNELWSSGKGELVVTFERKPSRVRHALNKFLRDKPHVYFVARPASERALLTALSGDVGRLNGDLLLSSKPILNWDSMLSYLADCGEVRRFVIVFDRFEHLRLATPSLPSLLQTWWNEIGRHRQILVLIYECRLPPEVS
jgi:hypothetical protein